MSDVSLELLQAKAAHEEPDLDGAEASAQGDLPVLEKIV